MFSSLINVKIYFLSASTMDKKCQAHITANNFSPDGAVIVD